MQRLETLKAMLEQNPSDTFARYGIAMEYVRGGELEQAVREFRELLATNPNYPPAYYHGGQTLEKLGRTDEARALYQQGMDVSTRVGDLHTRSEIQAVLDVLG